MIVLSSLSRSSARLPLDFRDFAYKGSHHCDWVHTSLHLSDRRASWVRAYLFTGLTAWRLLLVFARSLSTLIHALRARTWIEHRQRSLEAISSLRHRLANISRNSFGAYSRAYTTRAHIPTEIIVIKLSIATEACLTTHIALQLPTWKKSYPLCR